MPTTYTWQTVSDQPGNNEESPLFSICMPVYNAEKYLQECMDSILNQTYRNFELIVCDDKSTDNSLEILKQYAAGDPRIRLFANDVNQRALTTRNHLFREARGKYSMWMDADDTLSTDFFELAARSLMEYDCDILELPYEVIFESGKRQFCNRPDLKIEMEHLAEFFFAKMRPFVWYMWSKFFRTDVLQKSIPPDSREILDDVFYGIQIFYHARRYHWLNTGRPMYHYRFFQGTWSSLERNFNLDTFRNVCQMRSRQIAYNLSFAMEKQLPLAMMREIADYADLRSVINTLKSLSPEERKPALDVFFEYFGRNGQLVNGIDLPLNPDSLLNTMHNEGLI